ncbi:MAG: type VI secretion system baseplate subunit TssE [Erythrobacter sp.]|jgi:type VI secretion system protein ImpF|nr:type VI secretion system baseplate subunit TssE [Erythrobacter sp.]
MAKRIRLTPTLFDKLVSGNKFERLAERGNDADDDAPTVAPDDFRYFAEQNIQIFAERSLRASLMRDLKLLLNTIALESSIDLEDYPNVQSSVVNFGLRDFSGRTSAVDTARQQARDLRIAIQRFEPRLDPSTVRVEPLGRTSTPGVVLFRIEGEVMDHGRLVPVSLTTEFDLENISVEVRD